MKIKVDLITGIILLIGSIFVLLAPIFEINNIKLVLEILTIIYVVANMGRFIVNHKSKDYEGLFTSIIGIILFVSLFFLNLNNSLTLSLLIFAFVFAMSFIRLKKADYYHDKKNKLWVLEVTTLIIFIVSGLLTSISILLTNDGNIFMIGFLFFINGFIEIIDPIVNYIKK